MTFGDNNFMKMLLFRFYFFEICQPGCISVTPIVKTYGANKSWSWKHLVLFENRSKVTFFRCIDIEVQYIPKVYICDSPAVTYGVT